MASSEIGSKWRQESLPSFLPWDFVMILLLRMITRFLLLEWTLFFDLTHAGGALALFAILIRVCSGMENVKGKLPRFVGVIVEVEELFFSSLMLMLASCIINELDKQQSEDFSGDTTFWEWLVVVVVVDVASCSKLPMSVMTTAPRRIAGFASANNVSISPMDAICSGLDSSVNNCVGLILNLRWHLKLVSALNVDIVIDNLRFIWLCSCWCYGVASVVVNNIYGSSKSSQREVASQNPYAVGSWQRLELPPRSVVTLTIFSTAELWLLLILDCWLLLCFLGFSGFLFWFSTKWNTSYNITWINHQQHSKLAYTTSFALSLEVAYEHMVQLPQVRKI